MKFVPSIFFLALLCFVPPTVYGQEFDKDFIEKNLRATSYPIDPDAAAVVLYENHFTLAEDEKGVMKHVEYAHKIIKILKEEALKAANIHIIFPHDDDKNYVDGIRAITYNLTGDKIDSTVLTDKDLLKKGIVKKNYELSFSLPEVQLGSVIDYTYQIISDRNRWGYTWDIQEEYPKLTTEYGILFPEKYQFTVKAYSSFIQTPKASVKAARNSEDPFSVVKNLNGDPRITWIRKNVPGIKNEPYVVNRANHVEKLELKLTGRDVYFGHISYNKTWTDLNETFWTHGLRKIIQDPNNFLTAVTDSLIKSSKNEDEKIASIFKYVRAAFKEDHSSEYNLTSPDLKDIFNEKKGNEAGINTIFTAILVKAGISASPLILSTTSEISQLPEIALGRNINYLVTAVKRDSTYILLDASDTDNIIGQLPSYCYNGYAWILGDKGVGVYLIPQMAKDKRINTVKIYDFTDTTANVDITIKYGSFSSIEQRKEWKKDKEGEHQKDANIKAKLPHNIILQKMTIEGEKNPDVPLVIKYKCLMKFNKNTNNFFIDEALVNLFDENPFKATQRQNPVEFPYKEDIGYYLTVIQPDNITPDTPGPGVYLDYHDGELVYKKTAKYFPEAKTLIMNTSFIIDQPAFAVRDYETLRSFFEKMIAYNKEVLVLKKTLK